MPKTTTSPAALESAVQQFEHWRATRDKRRKIPNELWALVAPLMTQYSHNEIATALRVNHAQMKMHVLPFLPHAPQKSSTFVEYSSPLPTLPKETCLIEFACKNGSVVKISGISPTLLPQLVSVLMGD